MNIDMELLPSGTIRRLFGNQPKTQAKRKSYDPFGVPEDSSQCVHVEVGPEGDLWRCVERAEASRNGYLCQEHQNKVIVPAKTKYEPSRLDFEAYHASVVNNIIAVENAALASGKRERVVVNHLGDSILYLTSPQANCGTELP